MSPRAQARFNKVHRFVFIRHGGKTVRRTVHRPVTSMKQVYECATKLAHYDFMSAMQHAERLRKLKHGHHINIYPCKFCTGLHVGRCKTSPELTESFEGFMESE